MTPPPDSGSMPSADTAALPRRAASSSPIRPTISWHGDHTVQDTRGRVIVDNLTHKAPIPLTGGFGVSRDENQETSAWVGDALIYETASDAAPYWWVMRSAPAPAPAAS